MPTPEPIVERSLERLRAHYDVESALADRLRNASRAERPAIYARMYEELFAKVPDHPRLVRRENPPLARRKLDRQLRLIRPWIEPRTAFLEFGAGDCGLSFAVSEHARRVVAVDIADQRDPAAASPQNFELVVYDGYRLDLPDRSIDVAFSNDLIEHLHPDDVEIHFQTVHRLLRAGGCYLFTTPHSFNGPHDVSRFFSEEPRGFHLKEWTFTELDRLLRRCGYSAAAFYRFAKGVPLRQPRTAMLALERIIGCLPRMPRRKLCRAFLPGIVVRATR